MWAARQAVRHLTPSIRASLARPIARPTTLRAIPHPILPSLRTYADKPPVPPSQPPPPADNVDPKQPVTPESEPTPKDEPIKEEDLVLPGFEHRQRKKSSDSSEKPEYVSSAVQRRERLASLFFAASLLGLLGEIIYLGRPWDPQEATAHPTIPSTWSPIPFTQRIKARIDDYIKYFRDPAFEKLLPDPITDPAFQRPYTLVLSLEDLLVHTEWDQKHGWRMAKRPGLDYFLGYLFQYYELVVFTDLPMQTAMPMVQKINEYPGYIMHALFRDSCAYEGGKYVKDLTYLNRDLSKTIMIDTNPPAWSRQPSNAVKLPPWKGDPRDKTLIALLPFLEYVAAMSISDVRPMIESYGDKDLPSEFARREAIARAKFMAEIEEEKKKSKNSIGGFFGSALGTTRSAEGEKWIFDRMREQGQKAYEETQRSLMESKEEIMKEQAEQERQMQEGMRTSLGRLFTEGIPKPPTA